MTDFTSGLSPQKTARIAGLIYLVTVITGFFIMGYVPGKLIVWNNPAVTFKNLIASETLFRLSILADVICYSFFLLLPLALYKLLKPVNKTYALLMVLLAEVSIPISFVNIGNKFTVLTLIGKAGYLHGFGTENLQAQVMLNLHFYSQGNHVASVFWGLWLFPFGYLIYRSGFLPQILGILLMLGCFGYLMDFTGDLLSPAYNESVISNYISLPASIGEVCTCLWLIIMGVKKQKAV